MVAISAQSQPYWGTSFGLFDDLETGRFIQHVRCDEVIDTSMSSSLHRAIAIDIWPTIQGVRFSESSPSGCWPYWGTSFGLFDDLETGRFIQHVRCDEVIDTSMSSSLHRAIAIDS